MVQLQLQKKQKKLKLKFQKIMTKTFVAIFVIQVLLNIFVWKIKIKSKMSLDIVVQQIFLNLKKIVLLKDLDVIGMVKDVFQDVDVVIKNALLNQVNGILKIQNTADKLKLFLKKKKEFKFLQISVKTAVLQMLNKLILQDFALKNMLKILMKKNKIYVLQK